MVKKKVRTFCSRVSSLSGFTLVELIVSVSIMVMVMTITLSGRPEAILRLSVSDAVSKTELLVRLMQLKGSSINSAGSLYGGAGVIFNRASSTQVTSFRDRVDDSIASTLGVGNGLYGDTVESGEVLLLDRGNRFGKLCVTMSTSTFLCNDANTPAINNLTISFNRPTQKANIYINNSTAINYSAACVQIDSLKSPLRGYVKSIRVYKSGMIVKSDLECY
jgi:prepilin-type N-terminal cleavage/methylation domain-containing protein